MLWAAWDTTALIASGEAWSSIEVTGYNTNSEESSTVTRGFSPGDSAFPGGGTLRVAHYMAGQWQVSVVGGSGTVYISRIVGIK